MADSITCPVCNMTSYHPKDIEHGWCGNCHTYTGPETHDDPGLRYLKRMTKPIILTPEDEELLHQLLHQKGNNHDS